MIKLLKHKDLNAMGNGPALIYQNKKNIIKIWKGVYAKNDQVMGSCTLKQVNKMLVEMAGDGYKLVKKATINYTYYD
jgi:hypothetical protein